MDTTGAVWHVIHVTIENPREGSATFRIGTLPPAGKTEVEVSAQHVVNQAIKLCLAQGHQPPFLATVLGPFDEDMAWLVYNLFEGDKLTDAENAKMIAKLKEQTAGIWINARAPGSQN